MNDSDRHDQIEALAELKRLLDDETLLSHRLSNEGGLNLPCLVE